MNIYAETLEKIKTIERTVGTSAKMSLFGAFIKDENFAEIAKMILDPYRMFGVRHVRQPVSEVPAEAISMHLFLKSMMQLETRQITGLKATQLLSDLTAGGVPAELLHMILQKDMKCGLGAESANKVKKDFVPSFKVALAKEYEEGDTPLPLFISPKFDGLRCLVMISGENVRFVSRNGLDFPALSGFADRFKELGLDDIVLDCEVLAGNHFNDTGVVKKKKAKADNAIFQVFDYIPMDQFMARESTITQEVRLMHLERWLGKRDAKDPIQYCPHYLVYTDAEVVEWFKKFRALGLEGVVGKNPKAVYQFKRSNAWTKVKDFVTYDLPIVRMIEGEGKFVGTLGAMVVLFRGKEVKIGTGFSEYRRDGVDYVRDELWAMRENLEGSNSDKIIVEVSAHEVTPDGSLRHGRYHRIRHDKTIADVNDGTDGKGE